MNSKARPAEPDLWHFVARQNGFLRRTNPPVADTSVHAATQARAISQSRCIECERSSSRGRYRFWSQSDHLTPAWRRLSGGCHLNRAIDELIERAGFRVEWLEKGYMQGPKPMTFMYEGSARPGKMQPRLSRTFTPSKWPTPSRRADHGRDCGAAEIRRIAEKRSGLA